jgi:hypothetical protein
LICRHGGGRDAGVGRSEVERRVGCSVAGSARGDRGRTGETARDRAGNDLACGCVEEGARREGSGRDAGVDVEVGGGWVAGSAGLVVGGAVGAALGGAGREDGTVGTETWGDGTCRSAGRVVEVVARCAGGAGEVVGLAVSAPSLAGHNCSCGWVGSTASRDARERSAGGTREVVVASSVAGCAGEIVRLAVGAPCGLAGDHCACCSVDSTARRNR